MFVLSAKHYSKDPTHKSQLPESFPPAISYLIGVTPLGIVVGLFMRHHVSWSWWLVFLLVTEGIFIGLYNFISFMAIRRLPLVRYQTIYQSYELVVIVLGWTLLKERLSAPEVIGALLLLLAALIAIRAPVKSPQELHTSVRTSAVTLTLLAALVMGIGLVTEKAALRHMDMGAYFIFGYGTQTLAVLALAAKDVSKETLHRFKRYDFKRSLLMGILSATTGFFYIAAIVKSNNISLITALAAFVLPLVVLGGYLILRERDSQKALWGGMAIGFVGLIISALH
jgi:drug/metabolite transporter (DMT)-like permease